MWLVGPLVTALVFGVPVLVLYWVTRDAERCFASIPERRGDALPACDQDERYLAPLARLPFIDRPAIRAREEIVARMATWRYLDAAVGHPDREALTRAFEPLRPAAYMIWEGSMRLRMDEVGPPMPVPEPGALAFSVGDRHTLDERATRWTQHYTATRTIEAALVEARLDRAIELAALYRELPSTDLRVLAGALLCAGGRTGEGIPLVADVEADRAAHRTANFARNFGGARVVLEACAHAEKRAVPPVPAHGEAGGWDHRARLLSMRMRHDRAAHPACDWSDPLGCRADPRVGDTLTDARESLRAPVMERHRLALLASIADSMTSPGVAKQLGEPRPGEPPLADHIPLFAEAWLADRPDAPFVTAERYEASALHLAEIDREALAGLVRVLLARAAVGYARRGDLGAADRCIVRAELDDVSRVVLRSLAALVAGDRVAAKKRAEAEASRHPRLLALRAELALPDEDQARALAREALTHAQDGRVRERVRWLLASLGVATRGSAVVEPASLVAPPRYPDVGRPSPLTSEAVRVQRIDDVLAVWHGWIASDNPRQSRYRALAHRGDAPENLTAWLHAGARLASPGFSGEQTEMWLDALMAFDARRFSIRQVAFARWRAASWRGDAPAASVWRARFRTLAELSEREDLADLLRAARL